MLLIEPGNPFLSIPTSVPSISRNAKISPPKMQAIATFQRFPSGNMTISRYKVQAFAHDPNDEAKNWHPDRQYRPGCPSAG
jgi:hypothetical protein